jgi:hypothetical protein
MTGAALLSPHTSLTVPHRIAVRVRGAARVNQTSARIVAVASYSLVVTPSEGLTGAPPGQV